MCLPVKPTGTFSFAATYNVSVRLICGGGFFVNEQDMVKKLKNDPAALRSVMQSADGRALLGMLSGGDTAALGRAAQQAAAGDMSALSAMLQRVMATPEGAALVQHLEESLQR